MVTDCSYQIVFSGDLPEMPDFVASCPVAIGHFAATTLLICQLLTSLCLPPFSIETSLHPPAFLHHASSASPASFLAV